MGEKAITNSKDNTTQDGEHPSASGDGATGAGGVVPREERESTKHDDLLKTSKGRPAVQVGEFIQEEVGRLRDTVKNPARGSSNNAVSSPGAYEVQPNSPSTTNAVTTTNNNRLPGHTHANVVSVDDVIQDIQALPPPGLGRGRPQTHSDRPGAYPMRPAGGGVAAAPARSSAPPNELGSAEAPWDITGSLSMNHPSSGFGEGLARASPVTSTHFGDLPQAQPYDDTNGEDSEINKQRKRNATLYLLLPWGLCVLVLAVVGVIVYLSTGKSNNSPPQQQDYHHQDDDNNNIHVELGSPDWKWDLSFSIPDYTLHVIQNDPNYTRPQTKAYRWMKQDPLLETYTKDRLVQRYAMAVFYYATKGDTEWVHQGGGTVTITFDGVAPPGSNTPVPPNNTGTGTRRHLQPGGSGPKLTQVNITSEPWLSYNTSECDWLSTAPIRFKLPCNKNHNIEILELIGNGLAGTLPEELVLLTNLEYFKVGKDKIGGTIISQFGAMPKLWGLHVVGSQLTGTIPSEIGQLSNTLKGFAVQGNDDVTGTFPNEFWRLKKLKELRIGNTQLEMSIPTDIHKLMPSFRVLFASRLNHFHGSLPSTLGLLANLSHFNIEENKVTGTLPSELAVLTKLGTILVKNNQLSGSIPSEYGQMQKLDSLDVAGNINMDGSFPLELANLQDTLEILHLDGTSITGSIPEELCGVDSLMFDCSSNDLLCGCGCSCN